MTGLRGRLVTASFVRERLPELAGTDAPASAFTRAIDAWWERVDTTLGPASSVRAVADVAVVPLLRLLDLHVTSRLDAPEGCVLRTTCDDVPGPDVVVVGWNEPLSHAWRMAVRQAITGDARWALCANGPALRVVDARRTWSRDYLEIDLGIAATEPACRHLLWTLVRGPAITPSPALLDRAAALSAQHGQDVCRALAGGSMEALALLVDALGRHPAVGRVLRPRSTSQTRHGARRGTRDPARFEPASPADAPLVLQHAITVLYRVLFLLFAEARGLVPIWHPVYRDRYSLETIVSTLMAGRPCRGLWHAVQAISRLAHSGCTAGELKVNAFNGRLFSAPEAASFDRRPVSDAVMGRTITAVSTRPAGRGGARHRILYGDLDVEQLGAVYEQLLEWEPASGSTPPARSRDARKSSGAFYTPREVTACLVRRTLAPLVQGRDAAGILRLRVLDPAMGSGAFLVAACRYLASALEDALIRDGRWHRHDVTMADRVALRRDVALRCLYGVDANPMAAQLARLSLWLTTLAADKPLSFLDHHLVAGDSLVGARPSDVERRPSRVLGRRERSESLPLFPAADLEPVLAGAAQVRRMLALEPDETAPGVREKSRQLAALSAGDTPLTRWSRLLDLWCAGWFWDAGPPPDRAAFAELGDQILHGRSTLPASVSGPLLERSHAIARRLQFLHWPLAFPEAFSDDEGGETRGTGFDAIIGNPPWDMVRGDSGAEDVRASRRHGARQLTDFVRESGVYLVQGRTHLNRYQLFLERALQLVRPGGRIGLVLPSGIASDTGAAALRRHLFDRADVDALTVLDNRAGIFPIHRSVRFALLTCTTGRPSHTIACRFGLTSVQQLDEDRSAEPAPLAISRRLIARLSGDEDLGIPEVATALDLRIVERVGTSVPWLGSEQGWHATFGRELNASDDRRSFVACTGRRGASPVVEGKQIDPFRVSLERCRFELRSGVDLSSRVTARPRIAYRDVASATNRLTLIAAIIPAHAVTTHTLFCLKTPLDVDEQHVLCALLNSFVANYLIRLRVNTHVTVSLVSRLPVPLVRRGHPLFAEVLRLSRRLCAPDAGRVPRHRKTGIAGRAGAARGSTSGPAEEMPEYAELQAVAAHLYGLSETELAHVLSTFPLIGQAARTATLAAFRRP